VAATVVALALAAGCSNGTPDRQVDAVASSTSRPAGSASVPSAVSSSDTTTPIPTTTTAPPTTTTTTPPLPGPKSITLAFAGDLLPHLPLVGVAAGYGRQSGTRYDFTPMLAPMRPVIEGADVAICHLEVPMAADQDQLSGYPSFGAPVELVDAVKATGYDGCSTASNHSLDQGRAGIDQTLGRFDQDGLKHTGTARTADEGAAVTLYDVGGAKIAHLSYAYGFNGYQLPGDAPFAANQIDVNRIHADATRARHAGAQLVVVSLHWGTEYRHEPDAYQRQVAADLLPWPDIDVIVGHHAHVVQPIEQVDGTYVVWGLGNQLANQPQVPKSDGLTVILHADKGMGGRYRVAGIEAVPTWIDPGSFEVLPIVPTLSDPAAAGARSAALAASYDRTAAVLASTPVPGLFLAPRP
jgi:poly-gamma-glutamate synthesis protein (capsule biosynthesis protein)